MTDGRGAALLRPEDSSPRAAFVELFSDLVFVFALSRVSARLVDDLAATDMELAGRLARTGLLFLALWLIWSLTAWVTSRYEPERAAIQLYVVITMFGSMVMAVALPRALEERAIPFAVAYVAVQLGRPLLVVVALRGHPRRLVPLRLAAWTTVSGVFWLTGAFVADEARLPLWVLAVTIDCAGFLLGWPLPRLGPAPPTGWRITGEHLAERYQQIFLIALGETILIIGLTYSGEKYSLNRAAAFTVAFLITVLLWRIYFHRAGHLLAEALRVVRSPARLGTSVTRTHLLIVAAVLVTAVGQELVIVEPFGRSKPAWLIFIIGGPALFLLARARFEYEIFGRVSWSRSAGVLALMLLALPLAVSPPVVALAAVAAVLAGVAIADGLRSWGRAAEMSASPLGGEEPGGNPLATP